MHRLIAAIIIFIPLLSQCHPTPEATQEPRQLWAEQALVEGGIPNITPPTHLDILMDPRDNMQTGLSMVERCEAWGGELIFQPLDESFICESVDY